MLIPLAVLRASNREMARAAVPEASIIDHDDLMMVCVPAPLPGSPPADWVPRLALAQRRLHEHATIVPMRVGTALADESAVTALLAARAADWRAMLARLDGLTEISLRIADLPSEPAGPSAPAAGPQAPRASLGAHARTSPNHPTPGRGYLRARAQHFEQADGIPPGLEQQCRAWLAPILCRAAQVRLEGGGRSGLPAVQALVRKDLAPELLAEAESTALPGGARLIATGPWPPHSFVGGVDVPAP